MTGLLEEECKRRACIEQVSLQRIAELEAQVILLRFLILCIPSNVFDFGIIYLFFFFLSRFKKSPEIQRLLLDISRNHRDWLW